MIGADLVSGTEKSEEAGRVLWNWGAKKGKWKEKEVFIMMTVDVLDPGWFAISPSPDWLAVPATVPRYFSLTFRFQLALVLTLAAVSRGS